MDLSTNNNVEGPSRKCSVEKPTSASKRFIVPTDSLGGLSSLTASSLKRRSTAKNRAKFTETRMDSLTGSSLLSAPSTQPTRKAGALRKSSIKSKPKVHKAGRISKQSENYLQGLRRGSNRRLSKVNTVSVDTGSLQVGKQSLHDAGRPSSGEDESDVITELSSESEDESKAPTHATSTESLLTALKTDETSGQDLQLVSDTTHRNSSKASSTQLESGSGEIARPSSKSNLEDAFILEKGPRKITRLGRLASTHRSDRKTSEGQASEKRVDPATKAIQAGSGLSSMFGLATTMNASSRQSKRRNRGKSQRRTKDEESDMNKLAPKLVSPPPSNLVRRNYRVVPNEKNETEEIESGQPSLCSESNTPEPSFEEGTAVQSEASDEQGVVHPEPQTNQSDVTQASTKTESVTNADGVEALNITRVTRSRSRSSNEKRQIPIERSQSDAKLGTRSAKSEAHISRKKRLAHSNQSTLLGTTLVSDLEWATTGCNQNFEDPLPSQAWYPKKTKRTEVERGPRKRGGAGCYVLEVDYVETPKALRRSKRKSSQPDRLSMSPEKKKLRAHEPRTGDNPKGVSCETKPAKGKRKSAGSVNDTWQSDNLPALPKRAVTDNTKSEVNAVSEEPNDEWTERELGWLRQAHQEIDPKSSSFWEEISEIVQGKSSAQCREKWFSFVKTPKVPTRRAHKSAAFASKSAPVDDDDIFDATPMKALFTSMADGSDGSFALFGQMDNLPDFDFGSAIKVARKSAGSSIQRPPRNGYKTYIKTVKRGVNKGAKARPKNLPKGSKSKSCKNVSAKAGDGDIQLSGRMSPGGTVHVHSKYNQDDEPDYMEDSECDLSDGNT
jgi:hypothetical protein